MLAFNGKTTIPLSIQIVSIVVEKKTNAVLAPYELTNTQFRILMLLYFMANPKVEICACIETKWVRIEGVLIEDDRMETRQAMLDAYPFMKKTYAADDGNMQVLYFKDATATFDSFSGEHNVIKF